MAEPENAPAPEKRGPGRPKGSLNKRTILANSTFRNALDILLDGEFGPLEVNRKITRMGEAMAARRFERFGNDAANMPGEEFDRVWGVLRDVGQMTLKQAEFVHAKMRSIEWGGSMPAVVEQKTNIENKIQVVLVDPHERAKVVIDGVGGLEPGRGNGSAGSGGNGAGSANGHDHDEGGVPAPLALPGTEGGDL